MPRMLGHLPTLSTGMPLRLAIHAQRFRQAGKFEVVESWNRDSNVVAAFSLYGRNRRYLDGAMLNIELFRKYFPEVVCRFYVSKDLSSVVYKGLLDAGAEVFLMNALGTDHTYRFWRFLASEDTSKRIFLVRDIDSAPSDKEVRLFREWTMSGKQFHIIRDHYSHNSRIMAGMWGGYTQKEFLAPRLKSLWKYPNLEYRDQSFLEGEIYPRIRESVLVHDIMQRFEDEDPSITEVDECDFSFIGELATDLVQRDLMRQELKRLHIQRSEIVRERNT